MPDQLARERSTTLVFYGCIILLGYLIYLLFEPFLVPLAWAAIFAAYFFPRYKQFERRYGKTASASICTAGVTLIIVVPFVLIAIAFIQQASQTIGQIDLASNSSKGLARVQRAWVWAQRQRLGQNIGSFEDFLKTATAWLGGVVASGAGVLLRNIAVVIVDLVIMLFALFFFFRDGDAIMNRVRRVLPFDPTFRDRRIAEAGELVRASISAGLIVAIVQGAVGGIAFAVLGLGAPIFWGVMMAFFALLPLGAWVIWAPVAGWLVLTGQIGRGIALIAIGAGVVGLIDNILRPLLMSGRTQMNGLLVFISLLGGLATFGLLGLVLGPIIMATTISFVEAYATERRDETR
ncbi:MAG TPA: AI-2E family transporter [Vicinamibacterales bacterium]|nr:AI-2E family transporter [Vicinamibacterales bacterium]